MAEPKPAELNQISAEAEKRLVASIGPDLAPEKEETFLAAAQRKEIAEAVHKELENLDFLKEIQARERFAYRLFWIVVGWITAVIAVVLLQGVLVRGNHLLDLHDNVLMAFIGGTTVNVLGLLAIVVRYLFYRK